MFLFALVAVPVCWPAWAATPKAGHLLTKVAELDDEDRMGARRLLAVLDGGGRDEDA